MCQTKIKSWYWSVCVVRWIENAHWFICDMTKSGGSKVSHLPSISQYICTSQWGLRPMDINRSFYITGCFGISEGCSNQPSLFERIIRGWVFWLNTCRGISKANSRIALRNHKRKEVIRNRKEFLSEISHETVKR